MAKFLRHREYHEETTFAHYFGWRSDPNAGFAFNCDKEGNVLNLQDAAQENYNKCLSGEYDVIDQGVIPFVHRWTDPAAIECPCGAEVELYGFTNTCEKCSRDFNQSGQELAPREFWGEETGESLADILQIP